MSEFHGTRKNRSYFEGWYFKHQNQGHTVAFIPGINYDENGIKSAFVQVITDDISCSISFPFSSFRICPHGIAIRVGNQIFSDRMIQVNLNTPEIRCQGTIKYGPLTPPKSNVMGPFRFVPFMECNHGVISMKHSLKGSLTLNGTKIDFSGGTGYIEKDWGTSFPKSYLWAQCNRFSEPSCSIMVSIANIPFAGFCFQGCIGIINFQGKEYRLATYNGVRVVRCDETGFLLVQRSCVLEAELFINSPQVLLAPKSGAMTRTIRENAACRARFRFYRDGMLLFDLQSGEAGVEYVK